MLSVTAVPLPSTLCSQGKEPRLLLLLLFARREVSLCATNSGHSRVPQALRLSPQPPPMGSL